MYITGIQIFNILIAQWITNTRQFDSLPLPPPSPPHPALLTFLTPHQKTIQVPVQKLWLTFNPHLRPCVLSIGNGRPLTQLIVFQHKL